MACSPDLVLKCHIPWGQALKLKHCRPNDLSPPRFSLFNCRHFFWSFVTVQYGMINGDHTKKGFYLKQKQFLSHPKLLHDNITKTSSTKCSISQNKLTKKTNKYILHKIDTSWWLCCLSLTLVGQPLGRHHVPTQRSDNWRQRLHLCFQMGLMGGNILRSRFIGFCIRW